MSEPSLTDDLPAAKRQKKYTPTNIETKSMYAHGTRYAKTKNKYAVCTNVK